jgi:hypothetical protein
VRRPGGAAPELGSSAWTGRLDFDVANADGVVFGRIEIVVRIDSVMFWWGHRTLAVIHREDLRTLLLSVDAQLHQDDLTFWWSRADELLLQIEDWSPLVVPISVVIALRQGI